MKHRLSAEKLSKKNLTFSGVAEGNLKRTKKRNVWKRKEKFKVMTSIPKNTLTRKIVNNLCEKINSKGCNYKLQGIAKHIDKTFKTSPTSLIL